MPRKPGFYPYRGWYVTSCGGQKHAKLCKVEEGERQAEIALRRLLGQRDEAQANGVKFAPGLQPQAKLVGEAIVEFLNEKQSECRPTTHRSYVDLFAPFIQRFGYRPLASLTKRDGIAYKKWLHEDKPRTRKKGVGLAPGSVNDYMKVVKNLLNWASDEDQAYIDRNPWRKIRSMEREPRTRVVNDQEFTVLLANCATAKDIVGGDDDFRQMLRMLRFTGMRRNELCNLKWEYVHAERITFPATVIKTKKRRSVTITSAVAEVLAERKRRFAQWKQPLRGYVFPKMKFEDKRFVGFDPSERQSPTAVTHRFGKLFNKCVRLGLIEEVKGNERIVLHSFRHTRATELSMAGVPLKVLMEELGHTMVPTTLDYQHPSEESRTELLQRLCEQETESCKPVAPPEASDADQKKV